MAHASAQLEDLLGDYLMTSNSGGSSQSTYSNTSYSTSTLSSVYTYSDLQGNLTSQNSNSAYYFQLALATDSSLAARFDTFTEVSGNGYTRVPLVSTTLNGGSGTGIVFAQGTCDTAGYDQGNCSGTWTANTAGEYKNIQAVSFPQSSGAWNSSSAIPYAVIVYSEDDVSLSNSAAWIPLLAMPIASGGVTVSGTNTTVTFGVGDLKYTIA
ncbi:MAG: hypothetical protein Unbinned3806contig1000_36 [Prokaryotic dsDNA virus sp.]|nr:MAG: hypothetical protein Unbinned3806contig1000_36 [Prokaryotic dsDNA virus sp.]|tara:strand:- start:34384 stop:35016 length:633 start_codon:yes stop_codon:yes gene_type:complete